MTITILVFQCMTLVLNITTLLILLRTLRTSRETERLLGELKRLNAESPRVAEANRKLQEVRTFTVRDAEAVADRMVERYRAMGRERTSTTGSYRLDLIRKKEEELEGLPPLDAPYLKIKHSTTEADREVLADAIFERFEPYLKQFNAAHGEVSDSPAKGDANVRGLCRVLRNLREVPDRLVKLCGERRG